MNTSFPKSIFSNQTLKSIAANFDIPKPYYDGSVTKRQFAALNYHELQNIWREEEHPITADEMTAVVGMYNMMSPFDTYFLCTRLPLKVLARVTGLPTHSAAALKRACNYLRDMTDDVYRKRDVGKPVFRYYKYSTPIEPSGSRPQLPAVHAGISRVSAVVPYEFADDKDDIIRKLRPYMNTKGSKNMPTTVKMLFRATPKHVLKRLWSGKGFEQCYSQLMK